MIAFTAAEIAEITNGRLDADPGITPLSVVTDSREATQGSLYVAKPGEQADGHDFLDAAFAAGAVLALVERPVAAPDGTGYPTVLVADAFLAMGAPAAEAVCRIRAARAEAGDQLTVVGITGSAGKTTTKDLLAGVLATQGATVSPQGSYNGEVGVPLTVFRAGTDTRYLVIEMGATGVGHIRYLAEMVKPDIGVVLAVGTAHAGEFGGVENIALAKGEMVEGLAAAGTAIINLDDERVAAMRSRTSAAVLGFSAEGRPDAQVQALNADTNAEGCPEFDLQLPDGEAPRHVRSRLIGAHHTGNLLAAASAAWAAGVPGNHIAESLGNQAAASRWRMERTERPDGVTIINDAYNANPESVAAALRTLVAISGTHRRSWAVLGPLGELGGAAAQAYREIGALAADLSVDRLVAVGEQARPLQVAAAGSAPVWVPDVPAALELLASELATGDVVLIKASRAAGLERLAEGLLGLEGASK
jgi:UDP-N-acetylmuramoyl-tripeptide--D-alanyl-D-alanine ligase